MDIEKTMEFILEQLADVSSQLADVGVKLGEIGVKQARTDRQIHGLQTLAKIGMRQIVALGAAQKRTDLAVRELAASHKLTEKALRDLAASQKRTDEKFQRWLDRGHNGKGR